MTLILTCVTPDVIVQAADMRLTCPGPTLHDDQSVKMTVFCGRAVFAYTGRACVDQVNTGMWIAGTISSSTSLMAARDALRQAAATELSAMPAHDRHMTIVGAGWAKTVADGDFEPIVIALSNLQTPGDWTTDARDHFILGHGSLQPGDMYRLLSHGVELRPLEVARAHRQLRRMVVKGASPYAISRTLVELIHTVADRSPLVGRKLVVASMPRSAVPCAVEVKLTGPLDWATCVFAHVRDDDAELWWAPNSACAGMASAQTAVSTSRPLPPMSGCDCPP